MSVRDQDKIDLTWFCILKWPLKIAFIVFLLMGMTIPSFGNENPRGLDPVREATYMPDLGGILNKTWHNQYGQKRDLSECIVLPQQDRRRKGLRAGRRALLFIGDLLWRQTFYERTISDSW